MSSKRLPAKIPPSIERFGSRALSILPPRIQRALAGAQSSPDGQTLAPDVALQLRLFYLTEIDDDELLTLEESREELLRGALIVRPSRTEMAEVREVAIPEGANEIAARLYRPIGGSVPLPLVVYFHGGGWVEGDTDSHDGFTRLLASMAGVSVLSVAYRTAPEHPFPAAVDDAVAAYRWAVENAAELGADPGRIAVGGDSAGGNLAAVTAIHARDAGFPQPAMQLLIYPVTDLSRKRPSYRHFSLGYYLTEKKMDWYRDNYLERASDAVDPRVSPILTGDLSGLPPAQVVVAALDTLRDEGEEYAHALRDAGVDVDLTRYDGLIHAFINLTGVSRTAHAAVEDMALRLRLRLNEDAAPAASVK